MVAHFFGRIALRLLVAVVALHSLTINSFAQSACFKSLYDYSFSGASNGQCIARGDFDEDGEEDVIIGVFLVGGNQMRFVKGLGNGKFAAPVTFDAGSRPLAIVVYDFDQDTHLDLAVACNNTHLVNISFGNGDGTFDAPAPYPTASGPNSLALGDFNNDTRMDIVVSCQTSGMYLMTAGLTPGTFTVSSPALSMGTGARGIIAADLNGDGNLDAAACGSLSNNVAVRFGDGTGSFGAATTFAVGTGPLSIAKGDFDGDLDVDFAVSNATTSNITICLNNGVGTFATSNITVGAGPNTIIADYLDADANLDLALVCDIQNSVNVLTGTGTGTFNTPVVFASVNTPKALVAGLFDGDADLDLVITSNVALLVPSMGIVSVMLGTGTANFSTIPAYGTDATPNGIAMADFDEDGNMDAVTANSGGNTFSLLTGLGDGTFNTAVNFAMGTNPVSICVADFNGDNHVDVATANNGSNDISMRLGNGDGTFGAVNTFATINNPTKIITTDVGLNGFADFVVVGNTPDRVGIMQGDGVGGFTAPTTHAVNSNPVSVTVGKFNADANPDLAVLCQAGTGNISLLMGNGGGNFLPPSTLNISSVNSVQDIACGDLDGDGDDDLVVAANLTNNLAKFICNGAGGFAANINSPCNSAPTCVYMGDFNQDSFIDVAIGCNVTTNTTGLVDIFMNNGSGTLAIHESFATRVSPKQIAYGDLNNDNMPDLTIANSISNQASVLINTTPYITALGPDVFCGGGSVDLESSPALTYLWNTSATTQILNVVTTGFYNVTTSSSFSDWCISTSANDTVTAASLPTISGIAGATTICPNTSTVLTASSGATSPTFEWYDAPVGGTLLFTGAVYTTPILITNTTYYVQATDGVTGCSSNPRFGQMVTVTDVTPPVISNVPADIILNAGAGCTAVATWAPATATDNCTLISNTPDIASGSTFNLGTTTVTYTAIDDASNSDTASFTVTVNDVTDPILVGMPGNIMQPATAGLCTASVGWTDPTGTDNCSIGSLICSHTNPFTFPVGTTMVTYTLTDGSGNQAVSTFDVTVNDTQLPVINNTPSDITANVGAGTCCATVNWTAPMATDNCGISSFTSSQTSGTCFPVGVTTVTYTATDVNGNIQTSDFTITVTDNINPTIVGLPVNQTVNASNGACFRPVTWTSPTVNDNCPGASITQTLGLPSGSNYPVGANVVTFTATDANGNTAVGSFTITVVDNQLPFYTSFPANINTVCGAGLCGTNVSWTAPVNSDNCGIQNEISSHNSGDFFPVGATPVQYTLTDIHGNVHIQSFTVTVVDNIAPVAVGCPSTITACEGTTVNYTPPTGTDNCPGVTVTQTLGLPSGSVFPVATTLCTYRIEDAAGNFVNCNFNVIVNANPTASLTLTDDLHCDDDPVYTLAGGSPVGGTWSGTGVTGSNFNPATAGVGSFTITYTYTALNGCIDVVTDLIEVDDCNSITDINGSDLQLNVYPNPNSGEFTIEIPAGYENSNLNIFNGIGELIQTTNTNVGGKMQISLGFVNPGMYLIRLTAGGQKSYTARIVVN